MIRLRPPRLWLLQCILLGLTLRLSLVHATLPLPLATAPYTRSQLVDDVYHDQAQMSMLQPPALSGVMSFATVPMSGTMFLLSPAAIAANEANITYEIVLPHSTDDPLGCNTLTQSTNDEGQSLNTSMLLLQRGGCGFDQKVIAAQAVNASIAIYNCPSTAPTFCTEGLEVIGAYQAFTIPYIFIAHADGAMLSTYLQGRRNWMANGQPAVAPTYELRIINDALVNVTIPATDYSLPVKGSVTGTGPIDPADLVALRAIADEMKLDPDQLYTWSELRDWSEQLTAGLSSPAPNDPCQVRLPGLWCEGVSGRVTGIHLPLMGLTGTLSTAFGDLTKLRYLDLSYAKTPGGGLTGAVPDSICNLAELRALQVQGHSLTALPDCIGHASSLMILLASENRLPSVPSTLPLLHSTLVWLDLHSNLLSALPANLTQLSSIVFMDLSANPTAVANVSSWSFSGMPSLNALSLANAGLRGTIDPAAFNGLANLVSLNLAGNALSGSLPAFQSCASLYRLELQRNSFSGDTSMLSSLYALSYLDLSSNLFVAPGADLSTFLQLMLPNSIAEIYLDLNPLAAAWPFLASKPAKLTKVSLRSTGLTGLPSDLFQLPSLSYLDASNNALTNPFPSGSPQLQPQERRPAFTFMNLKGNPSLQVFPLPAWMNSSESEVPLDGYLCHPIQAAVDSVTASRVALLLDAAFSAFKLCRCASSQFGDPAAQSVGCKTVPLTARVRPFALPQRDATPSAAALDFAKSVQAAAGSAWLDGSPVLSAALREVLTCPTDDGTGFRCATSALLNTSTVSQSVNSTHLSSLYPASISPRWYGAQSASLSTSWTIDLADLRSNVSDGSVSAHNSRANATSIRAASRLQPVRLMWIRLHIDRSVFNRASDAIDIYNLQGTLVDSITGIDARLNALPTVSAFTLSTGYQSAYASSLSALVSPVLWEVAVFSNAASIQFRAEGAPSAARTAFVLTYSFEFSCATGLASTGGPVYLLDADQGTQCLQLEPRVQLADRASPQSYANFTCSALHEPGSAVLQAISDPATISYTNCTCIRGSFGIPPFCENVPLVSALSARGLPLGSPLGHPLTSYTTLAGPFGATANSTLSELFRPSSFSDAWFGAQRLMSGLDTTFEVDLRTLRAAANRSVEVIVAPMDSTAIGGGDPLQPVRAITFRLRFSAALFSRDTDSLSIYNGDPRLTGERLFHLLGSEVPTRCTEPLEPGEAQEYTRAFGLSLPIAVCSVQLASGNRVSVSYRSRESQTAPHFVSTYAYQFDCPAGLELDSGNACSPPSFAASSLLAPVLAVALSLLLLLFAWVLRERWLRHKLKKAHAKDRKGVDEFEDDESEAEKFEKALVETRRKAAIKQLALLCTMAAAECVFVILTWLSVSRSTPSDDARDFSQRMYVALVALAIVSTMAFVCNNLSRFPNMIFPLWAIVFGAPDPDAQKKSMAAATIDDLRHQLAALERRFQALKITSLALLFDSLPVTILNVIKLYTSDPSLQHHTLIFGLVLLGVKVAQLMRMDEIKEARLKLQVQISSQLMVAKRQSILSKRASVLKMRTNSVIQRSSAATTLGAEQDTWETAKTEPDKPTMAAAPRSILRPPPVSPDSPSSTAPAAAAAVHPSAVNVHFDEPLASPSRTDARHSQTQPQSQQAQTTVAASPPASRAATAAPAHFVPLGPLPPLPHSAAAPPSSNPVSPTRAKSFRLVIHNGAAAARSPRTNGAPAGGALP